MNILALTTPAMDENLFEFVERFFKHWAATDGPCLLTGHSFPFQIHLKECKIDSP